MVVHPHAAALDGLTAASAQAKAAFEEEEAEEDRGEEGGGDSGGAPSLSSAAGVAGAGVGTAVPLDDAALDALAAAVTANAARNRWLEQVSLCGCCAHMLCTCCAHASRSSPPPPPPPPPRAGHWHSFCIRLCPNPIHPSLSS